MDFTSAQFINAIKTPRGAGGITPRTPRIDDVTLEIKAYAQHINLLLASDPDLPSLNYLPFVIKDPMDTQAFFKAFGSGVILCKILNQIQNGVVNTKIMKLHPKSVHEQIQNINLALSGAKLLGASFVNIQAEDVIAGSPLILSLIWKFIRMSGLKEVSLSSHPEIIHLMKPTEDPLEFVNNLRDKDGLLLRWVNSNLFNAGLPPVANLGKDLANGKSILAVMSQVCPPHVFKGINLSELLSLNDPDTRSVVILDIINKLDLEPILNEQNVLAGNSSVYTLFLGNLFHHFPGFHQLDINALTPHQLSALAEVKKQTKQDFDKEITQRFNRCSIQNINTFTEVNMMEVIDDEVKLIEERKKEFEKIQHNLAVVDLQAPTEPSPHKLALDRLYEQCEYLQNAVKGMYPDSSQYQANVPLCTGMSKFKQVEEEILHSYSCLMPSTPDDERYYSTICIDENLLLNQARDIIEFVTLDNVTVKDSLPVLDQVVIDIHDTFLKLHELFNIPQQYSETVHLPPPKVPVVQQQQLLTNPFQTQMPINHANEPQVPVVQQNVQQHAENPAIYQQTTYHQPAVTQPTQTHTEQHFDFPQNQTQMDFPGNQTQMDFPGTSTTQTLDFPGNSDHIQMDFPSQNQYTSTQVPVHTNQNQYTSTHQNQYTSTQVPIQNQQYTQTYNQQQQYHTQPQNQYHTQPQNQYQSTTVTHQTGGYVQQPGYIQTVVTHQPGMMMTTQQPGYMVTTVTHQPGMIIETTMPGRVSTYEEEVARRMASGMPLFS